jgi:hypothetical protein
MSFFKSLTGAMTRRKLVRDAASSDWSVAERAIKALPTAVDAETALSVLLPLSRGEGSRSATRLHDLAVTPSIEFAAGLHLRSGIAALSQIEHPKATDRLFEIIQDLPNCAEAAVQALGSRHHAAAADRLAAISEKWPNEKRWKAAKALWLMETEHAFQHYVRIQKATGAAFSDETMRKAWTSRMQELKQARGERT